MKKKELLILTNVLVATMPAINAAERLIEQYQHDTFIKSKSKVISSREGIINDLLSKDHSTGDNRNSDLQYNLEGISKYYNTGYNFGDDSLNEESLYNWVVYTRSLHALQQLGNNEYGSKLQEELDRAQRRLDRIDFYTDDKDYKFCLSGIWSIVAIFDAHEREQFLKAIELGDEIPKNQHVVRMIHEYQFDYK